MKIFKIILANLIIILLILGCVEYKYAKKWRMKDFWQYIDVIENTITVKEYYDLMFNKLEVEGAFTNSFRPDVNTNSNLKPILFAGCSFTYGDGLAENETVSYKTAEITGRPVYNRAGKGWGLAQYLYQAQREDFYDTVKEPEYLIYIYIEDHKNRLDKFKIEPGFIDFQPKYKVSGSRLTEEKPHFYDKIFFISDYQYYYNYKFNKITDETLKLYFTEAEKEIHKRWKNTKLVILIYPISPDENQSGRKIWQELEKENYTVINIKDLTSVDLSSKEYRCSDGWHPDAKVWDMLLPDILNEIYKKTSQKQLPAERALESAAK